MRELQRKLEDHQRVVLLQADKVCYIRLGDPAQEYEVSEGE